MSPLQQLLDKLDASTGDVHAQAALAAEFSVLHRPEPDRSVLRSGVDAAAVLRLFDVESLRNVLQISDEEAQLTFALLISMPFVESFRSEGGAVRSLHEMVRLGWRKQLMAVVPERFRALSIRAAACFEPLQLSDRAERIYHLLSGNPSQGLAELAELHSELRYSRNSDQRAALSAGLIELDQCGFLHDRAAVWARLFVMWTRAERGEVADLGVVVRDTLKDSRRVADFVAQSEALWLLGEVLESQGDMALAHSAFEDALNLRRRFADHDPENARWRRDLALGYRRLGDFFSASGHLPRALAAFNECLRITQKLVARDPSNASYQRDLALAHSRVGDLYQRQGSPDQAHAAFTEYVRIISRLVEQDPHDLQSRRELAEAQAIALQAKGDLAHAQAAFDESVKIIRGLAGRFPKDVVWLRELGLAQRRLGGILERQGNLAGAQDAYEESVKTLRQLTSVDPEKASWKFELASAVSTLGNVCQAQGDLAQARLSMEECVTIYRHIADREQTNSEYSRQLAAALASLGNILKTEGRLGQAQSAFEESLAITAGQSQARPDSTLRDAHESDAIDTPFAHLGETYIAEEHKGDFSTAREDAEAMLARCLSKGSGIAAAYLEVAAVATLQGDCTIALDYCAKAREHGGSDLQVQLKATAIEMWSATVRWNYYPDGSGADAMEAWQSWPALDYAGEKDEMFRSLEAALGDTPDRDQSLLIYRVLSVLPSGRAQLGKSGSPDVLEASLARAMHPLMWMVQQKQFTERNPRAEAACLLLAADLAYRAQKYEMCIQFLGGAAGAYSRCGDPAGVAACHLYAGDYRVGAQYSPLTLNAPIVESDSPASWIEAVDTHEVESSEALLDLARTEYDQAAAGFSAAQARRGTAAVTLRHGCLKSAAGSYAEAVQLLESAREQSRGCGDNMATHLAATHIIIAYIGVDPSRERLDLAEAIGAWGVQGSFSYALGLGLLLTRIGYRWLHRMRDGERARACFRAAQTVYSALGATVNVAQSMADAAVAHAAFNNWKACVTCLEDALLVYIERAAVRPSMARDLALRIAATAASIFDSRLDAEDLERLRPLILRIGEFRAAFFGQVQPQPSLPAETADAGQAPFFREQADESPRELTDVNGPSLDLIAAAALDAAISRGRQLLGAQ